MVELYFNEENPGPGGKNRIGLDLKVAPTTEAAQAKLLHMSDLGIRKVWSTSPATLTQPLILVLIVSHLRGDE
jgi:hypothetical protein